MSRFETAPGDTECSACAVSCPNVAIVTVNYNGTSDTMRCLDSLQELTSRAATIVVDNGSTPPADDDLQRLHPEVDVLRSDVNAGWAGGNNLGIRRALDAGAEYVLLLNNDTVVSPHLVERLVAAAEQAPHYGILGCIVCYMDEPENVNMDGCIFYDPSDAGFFSRQPVPRSAGGGPEITETEIVYGCCMLIRTAVFRTIGFIDERFFLIHEESDFCLRGRQAGFRCGIVGEPLVWHKGSSAFQRESRPLQRYYDARNLALLLKKHGTEYRDGQYRWQGWWKYWKHVYYMYCLRCEAGDRAGARAVLNGVSDGITGRYGPLQDRWRPLSSLLAALFETRRWWTCQTT